jgi:SAM-dependent methyltransferase
MSYRLYSDLASWWSHVADRDSYATESAVFVRLLDEAAGKKVESILELGSGSGMLASHIESTREVVLTDLSSDMLDVSRTHNPSSEHVQADMRTMRLDRVFDAVLLQDAVMYLTSPEDLLAAFKTAAAHLKPGGVLLCLPDLVKEEFRETSMSGGSLGQPAAQLLEWHWDPDPNDHTYRIDMSFLFKHEDGRMETLHEHHELGLYDRKTYCTLIREAGFELVSAMVYEDIEIPEIFCAIKKPIED